jgi:hypothetical protein
MLNEQIQVGLAKGVGMYVDDGRHVSFPRCDRATLPLISPFDDDYSGLETVIPGP